MKAALLALALMAPAHAEVVECPKFYPAQAKARTALSGAGMFIGEKGGQGELAGERREAKGGWDAKFGFAAGDQRWLVCVYGASGNTTWWMQLDPKTTSCALQMRKGGRGPADVKATCRPK